MTDAPLFTVFDVAMARFPALSIALHRSSASDFSRNTRLRLAIAVASRPLSEALENAHQSVRKSRQEADKLLRYGIRMASRCTPFGLFAGAALVKWGARTDLRLSARRPRRSRIDMGILLTLVSALEADPLVRRKLKFAAHPAASLRNGRLLLAGIDTPAGPYGEPNVTLRATSAVRNVIELASTPVTWPALVSRVRRRIPGASADQVEGLLTSLWRHGFLLTDLRPPLVNEDPATHILAKLETIDAAGAPRERLRTIAIAARRWDGETKPKLDGFRALADAANGLVDAGSGSPLQVDTSVDLEARTINRAVGAEIARAAELLVRLTPYPDGPPVALAYLDAFIERFGRDACVPLLDVVDLDTGLSPRRTAAAATNRLSARSDRLVGLAWESAVNGQQPVELDDDLMSDLETWRPSSRSIPRSLDLYALVAARSTAALDRGDFEVIVGPNVGSNAAGRNLGRFSDMLPGAAGVLRQLARREDDQSTILAELIYPPERARSSNVVLRQATRKWNVGVATSADELSRRWIELKDLLVCVRDGRLACVIPRATGDLEEVTAVAGHMLNHIRAPLVCRFLADIARSRQPLLTGFDWGPAEHLPMLPRIQSGRVILCPARWRLSSEMRPALGDGAGFERIRRDWRMPRFVHYRTSLDAPDHQLLLDLDHPEHLDLLVRDMTKLKPGVSAILQEALPAPDRNWVPGPGGKYAVELAVSLLRREHAPAGEPLKDMGKIKRTDRIRVPGSDWLYCKIYLHPSAEDAFIGGELHAFASKLARQKIIRAWTYVRYSDPNLHLRIRFRGDPRTLERRVLPDLAEWIGKLACRESIDRFSIDTYEREIERYGGIAGMEASEEIFAADSLASAQILKCVAERATDLDKTSLFLICLHGLILSLKLDPFDWAAANRGGKPAQSREYRERKSGLAALFAQGAGSSERAIRIILDERDKALTKAAHKLRMLEKFGELTRPAARLCDSYAHLLCNRLIGRDRTRENELLAMYLHCMNALRWRASHEPSD